MWKQGEVIGAICHGVLVPARISDPDTVKSDTYGPKVAVLTKDPESARVPPRSLNP